MAQVSFSSIFKSTSADQQEESQSFAGSSLSGASNIKFVSQDPTQVQFSGNNVPGNLTYTLGGVDYSIPGIISRLFKSGNTYEGFYFVDSGSDYAMASKDVTTAYILVWPGRSSAFPTSPGTYSTSSDPVDSALNSLLAAQPTLVGITQNEADLTLDVNQTVLYTFTFSGDIDSATFTSADITNTGTAGVTIGTITETSPGVFTVQVTGTSAGTINLAIPAGSVISSPTSYSLDTASQITDDQTLNVVAPVAPTISGVTAEDAASAPGSGDSSVVEGNPLRYTISLSAAGTTATDFTLAASGSAAAADYGSYTFSDGVTYNASTGKVTVPAGVTSFTITVPTVDDTAIESTETLVLTVGGVPGTGNITDNDSASISGVTAEDDATAPGSGDSSVVEGNALRYTISLSQAPTAATTFTLAASGTAAAADYGSYSFSNGVTYSAATGLITVPAGVTSFTITVPTVDDTGIENTETLVLTVGGVAGTGTITDNDAPTIAGVTAEDAATAPGSGDSSVVEGNPLRYTVALSGAPIAPAEFTLATSGTAATADYSAFTFSDGVTYNASTGKITVPAGVTSFTITAPTVDDTAVENTETLLLTIGGVPSTGTITDNDVPPGPTVSGVTAEDAATPAGSGDSAVVEGNPLRYTVTLSGATTSPMQYPLAPSGTAAAADYGSYSFSNGVTYDPATGLINVPVGVSSFTITVPTVDDSAVEPGEALTLTVGGVAGTGSITDNDAPVISGVSAEDAATAPGSGDSSVVEGNPLRYTISLSTAPLTPATFSLAASGTVAAADYSAFTFSNGVTYNAATGLITVPAGVTNFTITAPTVDDTAIESPETLVLTVGGVAGTGTITDNDSPSIAAVSTQDPAASALPGDNDVVEGNPLRFTVALTSAPASSTQFTLASSGSASSTDYSAYTYSNGVTYDASTGKITVPAGVASFTITAATIDDPLLESTENLALNVGGVTGTGTITDNDAPAAPTISGVTAEDGSTPAGSGDSSAVEGVPLRYTISLSGPTTAPTSYSLAASGTAAAADYGSYTFSNGVTYDPATGLITVPAGVTSFAITVPTVDDARVEPTETLTLTVGGVAGTGSITDNDVVSVSGVTAEDAATPAGSGDSTVVEGQPLRYTIALSDTTVAPTELSLSAGGSASPADYSAYTFSNGVTYNAATGKLSVPAGVSSFNIIAPTVDDTASEPSETLALTVGGRSATGTILDNDAIPVYFATSSVLGDDRQLSLSGNTAKNIQFFVTTAAANDPMQLKAWFNPLTGDWFYGLSNVAPPYECYVHHPEVQLGAVLPKGQGAFDVHTYVNAQGVTQIMSEAAAASLGLAAQGFHDLGDSYVFASLTGLPTV